MTYLLDPKIFNYLIMSLYAVNAGRWALNGSIADVCYWLSALAITATSDPATAWKERFGKSATARGRAWS